MWLSGAALCYAGFALMALTQDRHWETACGRNAETPRPSALPATVGVALLAAALILFLATSGSAYGSLMWATTLPVAAVLVTFTLCWCPLLIRPLARAIAFFRS